MENEGQHEGERTRACHVTHRDGHAVVDFSRETAQDLLDGGEFFWLDLDCPTPEDFTVLQDVFGFHPLAIEDSEHFGQRAKIDDYDDYVFLVLYGASHDEDRLVEVHCFYSARYLVTVHRDEAPGFTDLRTRIAKRAKPIEHGARLLYRIVDALVDSFFPVLADLDDRMDQLEDRTFVDASEAQLQEIFAMKKLLVGLRKAVTPERDMFARIAGGIVTIPAATDDDERYFRDVYDHLIRISDLIDTYRDLLTSSMDVYLSTVSNRMNAVMKQLTVIATIFLPLAWITGFFGQNFGWMVRNIGSWEIFLVLGVGTELAVAALMLVFFRRRGWF
ncbi:MAG TPA: magnesium/cobalt transporter CorA [Gaiellaceae bacterium]|nr:magnesium/cobalt transporter CorA [Gaiellaceae bacterium]